MQGLEGTLVDGRWRLTRNLTLPHRFEHFYEGRDEKTGATVMVKLLDTAWVPSKLLEERRVGALIGHPVFVRTLDVGTDAALSRAFFVREGDFADYVTLEMLLAKGPADVLEATLVARELLAALGAAHAKNVIIGFLPPGAIFVKHEAAGLRVRVFVPFTDYAPMSEEKERLFDPYRAPEQLGSLRFVPTVESDLYSIGALLFHMVAGEPPYDAKDALSLSAAIRGGRPVPIRSELGVPLALQQAIWKALERNPVDRFRSAGEFAKALEAVPA
jgi:serine/threonine-protein kinase